MQKRLFEGYCRSLAFDRVYSEGKRAGNGQEQENTGAESVQNMWTLTMANHVKR